MIPKKPAPGLDPWVGTGFRKRSCSNKKLEPGSDSIKTHKALAKGECNDVERRRLDFSREYNKLAIHTLGANASPIQTQWLQPGDVKIPKKLARPRFVTKYYERFLD